MVLECRGRIQGQYPIYLGNNDTSEGTLLGTSAEKTGKKGHQIMQWVLSVSSESVTPPPGKLPVDRTEGSEAFEVVGVDFAGPLKYRKSKKQEGKAYLIVYACSLTRALHLEVLTTMETTEFLGSLKRFIARRGRPKKIYSDNGGTFVAAAKWLRTVMKDERSSSSSITLFIHADPVNLS